MPETSQSPKDSGAEKRAKSLARQMMRLRYHRRVRFVPHPKQLAFITMGREKPERMLTAGNQQGKSDVGGFEYSYHLDGHYPKDWTGYRFDRPITAWAGATTNKKARDVLQMKLLGRRGRWGTGFVPRDHIHSEPIMSRGLSGLVDTAEISHISGGVSTVQFMSYEMDVAAWESDPIHLLWFDEEPPEKYYDAGQSRLTATQGISYMTFTPLRGLSQVVRRFYPRTNSIDRGYVKMGLKDALHIPESAYPRILRKYPEHERRARIDGEPVLGTGMVFSSQWEDVVCDPFEIPEYFAFIVGLDIGGGGHPTAFVVCAHDRDNDILYVIAEYKITDSRVALHATALKDRTKGDPVAWPHDAAEETATGESYAAIYAGQGCNMLPTHSTFVDGGIGTEPGVAMMDDRFMSGRLKFFSTCQLCGEEYRMYHRVEGKIKKEFDDLMSGLRMAVMMIRAARPRKLLLSLPDTAGMDYHPFGPGGR